MKPIFAFLLLSTIAFAQINYPPQKSGLIERDVTGTTSTDTILASDCGNPVVYNGSVAVAVTLPTAITLGNIFCAFSLTNQTTGSSTAVTVTPTTWSILPAGSGTIPQGTNCRFTVNQAANGWTGVCVNNASSGAGTVTVVSSGALNSTSIVTGGGTQTLQTPSATSTLSAAGNMSLAGTFAASGAGTFSAAGAGSTPGLKISGAAFAGTATTSTPQVYIVSAGNAVTSWNTAGTQFGTAPVSGFTGNQIDLKAAGGGAAASVFTVDISGDTSVAGTLGVTGVTTLGTLNATLISGGAFGGTITGAPTLSGNIAFTGTPTFSNALALGSSTATTQALCDSSTKISTTAFDNGVCTNIESGGSPLTMTGISGIYYNDTAAGYTFQLDAPILGKSYCFGNRKARAFAITVKATTGVTIYYKGVAGTVTTGTLVSGGAAGDFVCMVGTDTTTYEATGAGLGTWTNN